MKKAFLSVLMIVLVISAVCQPMAETVFASMTAVSQQSSSAGIAADPLVGPTMPKGLKFAGKQSEQDAKQTPETGETPQLKESQAPEEQLEQPLAQGKTVAVQTEEFLLSEELVQTALAVCQEYEVPPKLLFAVMEVESGFQTDAQNGACTGLMQIHSINLPYLQEQIGIEDLSDPAQNIRAGAFILGGYLSRYDVADSLMAYNLGEGGAKEQWEQGIHQTPYTQKILDKMN